MLENIAPYTILLASNSPRRLELLGGLGIPFQVTALANVDESYPASLPPEEVPAYISQKKAKAYAERMKDNTLLITADTVVCLGNEIFGKPIDTQDAKRMLRALSGKKHTVITGVTLTSKQKERTFSAATTVSFSALTEEEIDYYVSKYKPFDKAGAYGVQEWIGYVAVEGMEGSYFNVMGLPIHRLYQELKQF